MGIHFVFLEILVLTSSSIIEGYKVNPPFFRKMPPKLLTLTTPIRRDQRTLIWLQHQDSSITWSRWDAVVSSLTDYHRWYDNESRLVGVVLVAVEGETDDFLEDLYNVAKDVRLVLLSRTILSLKSEDYWSENFDNIMCLDDLLEQYPFFMTPWDQTVEDAISIFAIMSRYNRLVDTVESRTERFRSHLQSVKNIAPASSWLITQYFIHPQKKRADEIRECLIKNCASLYIDSIVLLNETDLSDEWKSIPGAHKIKQIVIGKRLTYYDVLTYIKLSVPDHVYTVIANADIYFDSTLLNLWKIDMKDRMLALLRWDDPGDGGEPTLFGPRPDSQDTWILLSDSVRSRKWEPTVFGFPFGKSGCDNAFAAHMLRQRFLICNPALSIQSFHLHHSSIRDYSIKEFVSSELYIHIEPTHLLDTAQEQVPPKSPQSFCNELVSFEVRSSSLSNEITYCTMLEKEGRYKWEASVENFYFEPAIPVYSWKNASVTPNGLVYDTYTIYTGKHQNEERFQYWNQANVDIFTPLQTRRRMMAIPFPDVSIFFHPDTYTLHYLSRASRLLETYPDTSIWIPNGFESYAKALDVSFDGVPFNEQTGCWAEEVIGMVPGPLSCELGREDITVLRSHLSSWKPSPTGQRCVVVTDSVITPRFVYEFITPFLKAQDPDWTVSVVSEKNPGVYDSIVGASLCILLGGPQTHTRWAKLWALPKDCCVVEFQQELAMDGEFQHLCHVSDWKSWIHLLAKGSNADVQAQIMEQLASWYKKNAYELLFIS